MNTQEQSWAGEFGKNHTNRLIIKNIDRHFKKVYKVSRSTMNSVFLADINKDINILEVGCNYGLQLKLLKKMGFNNLTGIDVNKYAIETAKEHFPRLRIFKDKTLLNKKIRFLVASAYHLPFTDNEFDLVFTTSVLCHIPPKHIDKALDEIYRCAKRYIWGFEYYGIYPEYTEIVWRKQKNFTWKADYPQLFINLHPDLKVTRRITFYDRGTTTNPCEMYMMEKTDD